MIGYNFDRNWQPSVFFTSHAHYRCVQPKEIDALFPRGLLQAKLLNLKKIKQTRCLSSELMLMHKLRIQHLYELKIVRYIYKSFGESIL
jgi:hypothetical protein